MKLYQSYNQCLRENVNNDNRKDTILYTNAKCETVTRTLSTKNNVMLYAQSTLLMNKRETKSVIDYAVSNRSTVYIKILHYTRCSTDIISDRNFDQKKLM